MKKLFLFLTLLILTTQVGGQVNPDELGTDHPEELQRFYQQEFAWLNSK